MKPPVKLLKEPLNPNEPVIPETPFEQFIVDFFKWGTVAFILGLFIGVLYLAFLAAGLVGPLVVIIALFLYFWMKFDGGRHAQH